MGRRPPRKTLQERVTSRLCFILRGHSQRNMRNRLRNLNSIPLVTDLEFEGIPISQIISPDVPDNGPEAESWFDCYFYGLHTGESSDPLEDLKELSKPMAKFISQGVDTGEQAVLLLWALSTAYGARLIYSNDTILVQFGDTLFGVERGAIVSRFCAGYPVKCHPALQLEKSQPLQVRGRDFCSMWVEANQYGRNAVYALQALIMNDPGFSFKKMANRARQADRPTPQLLEKWERMLKGQKDPLAKLYKHLVPRWMTQGEFGQVIRPLGGRPLEGLTPESQQAYITKMHHFFYNKSKKEEL